MIPSWAAATYRSSSCESLLTLKTQAAPRFFSSASVLRRVERDATAENSAAT